MATEILSVPEEHLGDVIRVIRAGLGSDKARCIHHEVAEELAAWCAREEDYLAEMQADD